MLRISPPLPTVNTEVTYTVTSSRNGRTSGTIEFCWNVQEWLFRPNKRRTDYFALGPAALRQLADTLDLLNNKEK